MSRPRKWRMPPNESKGNLNAANGKNVFIEICSALTNPAAKKLPPPCVLGHFEQHALPCQAERVRRVDFHKVTRAFLASTSAGQLSDNECAERPSGSLLISAEESNTHGNPGSFSASSRVVVSDRRASKNAYSLHDPTWRRYARLDEKKRDGGREPGGEEKRGAVTGERHSYRIWAQISLIITACTATYVLHKLSPTDEILLIPSNARRYVAPVCSQCH